MWFVLRVIVPVLLILALVASPVSASPSSGTISVIDDHGTTLILHHIPQRIIAMAPSCTEILFALGLGPRVVAASAFSNYPPAAKRLPEVIDYSGANLERIEALKPDLLVAAGINTPPVIARIRALGFPVLVTDPSTISGILHDITLVGTATGVSGRAATVVAALQQRINTVEQTERRAATHPRVFYEIDSSYYTAGHGSFIDSLITRAGGTNITAAIHNPYPVVSAETIIADNPQVIVLGDGPAGVTVASVLSRPGWDAISAVQHRRVYLFNDDLASRPGPRIVLGLETLARLIHPELFR
jgi:iron complex transport system substrate-binding protein